MKHLTTAQLVKKRPYNAKWMRDYRARMRDSGFLKKGKCPVCSMKLDVEFEIYHKTCRWWKSIHAKDATSDATRIN